MRAREHCRKIMSASVALGSFCFFLQTGPLANKFDKHKWVWNKCNKEKGRDAGVN